MLKTLTQRAGGLAIASLTRAWMSTLDYRAYYYDRALMDPAHPAFRGPAIFLFWHEYIPFPFYLRGHCNIAMLLSRHQDAEWLSQAARHMGFQTVRGVDQPRRGGSDSAAASQEPFDELGDHSRRSSRAATAAGDWARLSGV